VAQIVWQRATFIFLTDILKIPIFGALLEKVLIYFEQQKYIASLG